MNTPTDLMNTFTSNPTPKPTLNLSVGDLVAYKEEVKVITNIYYDKNNQASVQLNYDENENNNPDELRLADLEECKNFVPFNAYEDLLMFKSNSPYWVRTATEHIERTDKPLLLEWLVGNRPLEHILLAVSGNPYTPEETLIKLSKNKLTASNVAENPSCPVSIMKKLISMSATNGIALGFNPNTPTYIRKLLAKDGIAEVRNNAYKGSLQTPLI